MVKFSVAVRSFPLPSDALKTSCCVPDGAVFFTLNENEILVWGAGCGVDGVNLIFSGLVLGGETTMLPVNPPVRTTLTVIVPFPPREVEIWGWLNVIEKSGSPENRTR